MSKKHVFEFQGVSSAYIFGMIFYEATFLCGLSQFNSQGLELQCLLKVKQDLSIDISTCHIEY